jgi:DNA-binding CsgD family transcriptional regulator
MQQCLSRLGGHGPEARARTRAGCARGLELARNCAARLLVERAHSELVATGARPRHLVFSGVEALTPSERRVAAMAAEGMANRDIAQTLFVTPRAVESACRAPTASSE